MLSILMEPQNVVRYPITCSKKLFILMAIKMSRGDSGKTGVFLFLEFLIDNHTIASM